MTKAKKTIVHVNQHVISANNKTIRENPEDWLDKLEPPLTVKQGKSNTYTNRADIIVDGKVVATIIHSPDKPLSCGARVWIETYETVEVSNDSKKLS
jgi:hypothetical protein